MSERETWFYELPFGPAHSGSGNFRVKLWIDGERIVKARSDPGYLHRGFEKLMEYRMVWQDAVLADRICVLEPLSWDLVFAEAIDELMGWEIPERAKYIRVILAEFTRIQSHLIWLAGASMATGFQTGFMLSIGYRDYILENVFEEVTGARVYPTGYVRPGGVRWDVPKNFREKCEFTLEKIKEGVNDLERLLFSNSVFKRRTQGVGVLSKDDAIRLGATGPIIRASGFETDVRRDDPYEVYDKLDFEIPVRDEGDAYSRFWVGKEEVLQSIKIIREALNEMPEGPYTLRPVAFIKLRKGEVYSRIEAARGEAGIYVVGINDFKPYRVKIRGPSLLHLVPVLEHLLVGSEVADVPVIYWSLNTCPADMDR